MSRSSARRTLIVAALALAFVLAIPATAHAITRGEILSRARYWVDHEIPYSQTSYYQGYRTDCSGMASPSEYVPYAFTARWTFIQPDSVACISARQRPDTTRG